MTFLEAAIELLRQAGRPLTIKDLTLRAIEQGLLTNAGRTPELTMGARLAQELRKGEGTLLVRDDKETFGLRRYDKPRLGPAPEGAAVALDEDRPAAPVEAPEPAVAVVEAEAEAVEGGAPDEAKKKRRRRGGRGRGGKKKADAAEAAVVDTDGVEPGTPEEAIAAEQLAAEAEQAEAEAEADAEAAAAARHVAEAARRVEEARAAAREPEAVEVADEPEAAEEALAASAEEPPSSLLYVPPGDDEPAVDLDGILAPSRRRRGLIELPDEAALAAEYLDELSADGTTATAPVEGEVVDERTADEDRPMLEEIQADDRGGRGRHRRQRGKDRRGKGKDRERGGGAQAREGRGAEGHAGREGREGQAGREGREGQAGREGREGHAAREGREGQAGREGREGHAAREGCEGHAGREAREGHAGRASDAPPGRASDLRPATATPPNGVAPAAPTAGAPSAATAPGEGPAAAAAPGGARATLADIGYQLLRSINDGRPVHARQLASMALKRRLVAGDPEDVWRALRAALLDDARARVSRGLRPRLRHQGSGNFALVTTKVEPDLLNLEDQLVQRAETLARETRLALRRRLSKLPLPALENLARLLLERLGYSDIERVKRVEATGYLTARVKLGAIPQRVLIGVRSGTEEAGRRAVGELRAGVSAKQLDSGLLLCVTRCGAEADRESRQPGPPCTVYDGDAFAEALIASGVGILRVPLPVAYLDAEFFADLADSGQ